MYEQRREREKAAADLQSALTGVEDSQLKVPIEKKLNMLRERPNKGISPVWRRAVHEMQPTCISLLFRCGYVIWDQTLIS